METIQVNSLCRSKAGHDAGTVYLVIKEDQDFCYLADGRIRTLDRLKKKRKKHVQMIVHLDEELLTLMSHVHMDSDIIHILKLYSQRHLTNE